MRVIGFNHSVGEYNGKPYDNYIFCFYDKEADERNKFILDKVATKVKASDLEKMGYKAEDLVNKDVAVMYNRYGQIQMITVYGNQSK